MKKNKRRQFLNQLGIGGLLFANGKLILPALERDIQEEVLRISNKSWSEQISDEDFWSVIRQSYTVSPSIINLNNGGVSPQPKVVQEAVERYNQLSNEMPSYYMWRVLDKGREPLRKNLARIAGCSPEELAINRNASESLETIIFGLPLNRGDEVVLSKQDYPNMKNAWIQREQRDGIILKWIDLELPSDDRSYFVSSYLKEFNKNTKIVHLTHMINWTGQVLPVSDIAKEAKKRGVEVVIDGAHSFAHLNYNIPDLNGDYFGTSLHKWLCAPFGSGLLYVRKEKIKSLYPLFAAPQWDTDDIRKFEHLGTRSLAIEQAIGQAIIFHEMIGAQRKQDRLFYLKNYWTEKVKDLPGISIGTPGSKEYSGALALLQKEGVEGGEISKYLFSEHGIHVVPIKLGSMNGVRITPNVYTLTSELDILVEAISNMP